MFVNQIPEITISPARVLALMLVLLTDLLWWWNDLLVWVWVNTYYRSGRSGAKMLVRVLKQKKVVSGAQTQERSGVLTTGE